MNSGKFDEIVVNRADERVQNKINKFRKDLAQTLKPLTGSAYYSGEYNVIRAGIGVLKAIIGGDSRHDYPRDIWEREEKEVAEELLDAMDEMQKALIARGPDKDGKEYNHPAEQKQD